MTQAILKDLSECCGQATATLEGDNVLRGVKVLGWDSANDRRYLPEAGRAALAIYEGILVNIDHPESDPQAVRSLRDRFGRLTGATVKEDGVYSDLTFNPAHPMAESVRWWAKNDPKAIGLSHNAVGQGRIDESGTFVVEKILSVRSVDLVADPATVKGLFEHKQTKGRKPVKIKLKKLMEALAAPERNSLVKLIEDGMMDPEADLAAGDAAEPDHDAALKDGFEGAFMAVVRQAMSGDLDPKAAIAKIKAILKAHGDVSGKTATPTEEDDKPDPKDKKKDGEDMDESVKKHPAFKALLGRLDRLETEKAIEGKKALAERLIADAKLPREAVTDIFKASLYEARDEAAMKALVADRKQLSGIQRPKSHPAGATVIPEGASPSALTDDQFLAQIRR